MGASEMASRGHSCSMHSVHTWHAPPPPRHGGARFVFQQHAQHFIAGSAHCIMRFRLRYGTRTAQLDNVPPTTTLEEFRAMVQERVDVRAREQRRACRCVTHIRCYRSCPHLLA